MSTDVDHLQQRLAELEQHAEELRRIVAATDEAMLSSTVAEVQAVMRAAVLDLYPEAHVCVYEAHDDQALSLASADTCPDACARSLSPDTCQALDRGQPHVNHPDGGGDGCAHRVADRIMICLPLAAGGITHGLLVLIFPDGADRDQRQLLARAQSIAQRFAVAMTIVVQRTELHRRAHTDDLTGLLNRAAFVDAISRMLAAHQRTPRPCALLLLDLDLFKELNDTLGHAAGDLMLQQVGRCLQEHVREGDLCARFGGDEFAIVLTDADGAEAEHTAVRIRDAIQELQVEGRSVCVSIGVIGCDGGDLPWRTWDDLYRAADGALYRAKKSGGRCVVADAR